MFHIHLDNVTISAYVLANLVIRYVLFHSGFHQGLNHLVAYFLIHSVDSRRACSFPYRAYAFRATGLYQLTLLLTRTEFTHTLITISWIVV